jgi:diguanylate cyclase (GGDEF)-like protein/PAS domain S-box-containing protein
MNALPDPSASAHCAASTAQGVYQRIFEFSPDGLLVVDAEGHIALANARVEALFGYTRSELLGQPVEKLVPARFAARHARHRAQFKTASQSRQMGATSELFAQHKNGKEFPVDIMLSPMRIDGQQLTLCVVRDITERKAAQDALERQTTELRRLHAELELLANHDGLTGLYNWRAFYEHTGQMLKIAHRRRENVTLMLLDLDHFKAINDRFGHPEGDRVLQAVAAALRETARDNDIVARHGGEEFVVAALGLSAEEGLVAAERLRAAVAAIENQKRPITVSIGVATLPPQPNRHADPRALAELLDQADQALYAAKHNGRNQVWHYDPLHPPALASRPPAA